MKSLIIIFGVLIVGIIFIVVWDHTSKPIIDQTHYNDIAWRTPSNKEVKKVKHSFFHSDIDVCATYFIKKFEGEKYLIACDAGDGSYIYYTTYATENKVYRTSEEFASSLMPPASLEKSDPLDRLERANKTQVKAVSQSEIIEAR